MLTSRVPWRRRKLPEGVCCNSIDLLSERQLSGVLPVVMQTVRTGTCVVKAERIR